jgi:hypothetical protein
MCGPMPKVKILKYLNARKEGGGSTLVRIESPRLADGFFFESALNAEKPAFCSFKSQLGLFELT